MLPEPFPVREIRVELTRPFGHYLLRVARLPIPPSARLWIAKVQSFFETANFI